MYYIYCIIYIFTAAFMSSKRENGINHKEFGVTSEGIVVYVDVALRRSLNIDPTKVTNVLYIYIIHIYISMYVCVFSISYI